MSCRSNIQPTNQKLETVTIVNTVRDTTVVVKRDSASLKAWLECDSANNVILKRLQTQQGASQAKIQNVKLTKQDDGFVLEAVALAESLYLQLQLKDKIIKQLTNEVRTEYIEKPLKGWQRTMIAIGIIYLALTLIIVILTIILRLK